MVIYGLQTAGKRYLANDVDAKFERQLPHSGEVRFSTSLISLREKNISHRIHPPEIKLDNAKPLFQKPL